MRNHLQIFAFAIFCLFLGVSAKAQTIIGGYYFTGAAGSETTFPASVTAANSTWQPMSRGSALTATNAAGAFAASGWSTTAALDANAYFQFGVTANNGFRVKIDSVLFAERRSGTGPVSVSIRTSLDNYAADIDTLGLPLNTLTRVNRRLRFNAANFNNLAGVSYRFYAYGASGPGGTWRMDSIRVFGSIIVDGGGNPDPVLPPLYNIGRVTTRNASGLADSIGTICRLGGVAYGGNIFNGNGIQFTIRDQTGGIAVRWPGTHAFTFAEGDSVVAQGRIEQFRGLIQILVDTVINTGVRKALKNPTEVTRLGVNTVSDLVRVNRVVLVPGTWPAAPSGSGFTARAVRVGTLDTIALRIIPQTPDVWASQAPAGEFDVIGLGRQFSFPSTNLLTGFEMTPRYLSDIITDEPEPTEPPFYSIGLVTTRTATGLADSIGTICRLGGLAYGGNVFNGTGIQFTIRDQTGGISVRWPGTHTLNFNEGDSVVVRGRIEQFRGLIQILVDTIINTGVNKTIKIPTIVERLETAEVSNLVRINGLRLVAGTWPANPTGSGFTARAVRGTSTDTISIRIIPQTTDVWTSQAPTGEFDLIGIGSQFSSPSNNLLSGFQVTPRRLSDIIIAQDPAEPTLVPSPAVLNFGLITRGDSSTISQVLLNGTRVRNITFSVPAPFKVSTDGINFRTGIVNIDLGEDSLATNLPLYFKFLPTSVGIFSEVINLVADGAGLGTIALNGVGINVERQYVVNPDSVLFGTVNLGDSSAAGQVSVTGRRIRILRMQVNEPFRASTDGIAYTSGLFSFNLGPDSVANNLPIYFKYFPTQAGTVSQTVIITADNDLEQSVVLVGRGFDPTPRPMVLTVTPDSVNLGSVVRGQTGTASQVALNGDRVRNITFTVNAPFEASLTGANYRSGDFQIDLGLDSLATDLPVFVRFAPTAAGFASDSIRFNADGTIRAKLYVEGNGLLPAISLTANPTTLTFGTVNIGTNSASSQTALNGVRVRNISFTVNAPFEGSTDGTTFRTGDFTIDLGIDSTATNVPAYFRFSPTAVGAANATISISADGVERAQVTLSGNGFDPTPPQLPFYPIGRVTTRTATGAADSLNVNCRLGGIIYGVNTFNGPGVQFTIRDQTGGINVRWAGTRTLASTEGDSVVVRGRVEQFRGLIQIFVDTIINTGVNKPLKTPRVVERLRVPEVSDLVRVNDLRLIASTWPATPSGAGFTARAVRGTSTDTIDIRIIPQTADVWASPAPNRPFDLIGIGGQFSFPSANLLSGFQISPRRLSDILLSPESAPVALGTGIKLYPNPAKDQLNVSLSTTGTSAYNIINLQGKVVFSGTLTEGNNSLDISNLSAGFYVFSSASGNIRFVKE